MTYNSQSIEHNMVPLADYVEAAANHLKTLIQNGATHKEALDTAEEIIRDLSGRNDGDNDAINEVVEDCFNLLWHDKQRALNLIVELAEAAPAGTKAQSRLAVQWGEIVGNGADPEAAVAGYYAAARAFDSTQNDVLKFVAADKMIKLNAAARIEDPVNIEGIYAEVDMAEAFKRSVSAAAQAAPAATVQAAAAAPAPKV